jgi:hypothetical protein
VLKLRAEEVEAERLEVEDLEVKVDNVDDENIELEVRLREEIVFVSDMLELVNVLIDVLVASVEGVK